MIISTCETTSRIKRSVVLDTYYREDYEAIDISKVKFEFYETISVFISRYIITRMYHA